MFTSYVHPIYLLNMCKPPHPTGAAPGRVKCPVSMEIGDQDGDTILIANLSYPKSSMTLNVQTLVKQTSIETNSDIACRFVETLLLFHLVDL